MFAYGRCCTSAAPFVLAAAFLACGEERAPQTVPARKSPREVAATETREQAPATAPIVFIIADSSGSMERLAGCRCETPTCSECEPDCKTAPPSRWVALLAGLTGSFEREGCTSLERTAANGATYDLGYYVPYHRPLVEEGQRRDGLIDVYGERVRFGLAVFDGIGTYDGAPALVAVDEFEAPRSASTVGLWSFGTIADGKPRVRADGSIVGAVGYPRVTERYLVDTGLRSEDASNGALAFPRADAPADNAAIERALIEVRPYGGTPIAAALDDLDVYLRDPARGFARGAVHVVLITDGYPDDDFRLLGCDCRDEAVLSADCRMTDASLLSCPYPLASEAARALRCGQGVECDDGVIEQLFVVSYESDAPTHGEALDEIAVQGGTDRARVGFAADLSSMLSEIMGEILTAPR
jgi:hypothetical protein